MELSGELLIKQDIFPLVREFAISRGSRSEARVLVVEIRRDGLAGRGECVPYTRYGETMASVRSQISGLPKRVTRDELQNLLPAGAARNAVDCALWDLEAKAAGKRVWELAGLPEPAPRVTAYTLSLDTPEAMHAQAVANAQRPLLKVKLGASGDIPRLEAVRAGAPNTRIVVDANEGWSSGEFAELSSSLVRLGVEMVEQPFPAGRDEALLELDRPVAVCADESCHDRSSLPRLRGKYDMINIKLDKTGGLTEALALRNSALEEGYGIMVGCMVASSLAMAPAVVMAQDVDLVDIDGPLLLAGDRENPLVYDDRGVHPPDAVLWG